MSARDHFESALGLYNIDQLKMVVDKALKMRLEDYVRIESIPVTIHNLLVQLEMQDMLLKNFLLYCMNASPRLRDATLEYYKEFFGIALQAPDPYVELVVFNNAFVDRQDLRDKLRNFFTSKTHFLLATKGPRFSGRSHCASFIKYVAKTEGIEAFALDMLEADVESMISELIDDMRLPLKEFRDRMAQHSTQAKGFISALRGIVRDPPFSEKRWCLVFDHHDRDEIDPEVRAFVEGLMQEVAKNNLPDNISIILLGQGDWAVFPYNLHHQVIEVSTPYIENTDVERYLNALASKNGRQLTNDELTTRRDEVLDSLNLKELKGMAEMSARLRKFFTN
ncbi:hypothetical protein [Chitinophaga tropicalis]|uniref:Uncharacterized protein n=1 Tax=Chitinophaga tropicalis TaxID=2683588 RepID=A0A7K1UBU3_9BACT|nr:hypothetical protein [Chitinophaga tropicalis]MVT11862.1 hypothetical protein [Chitinophaga tropicalis]